MKHPRLTALVIAAVTATPAAAQAPAFNPAISVIIDGVYFDDDRDHAAPDAGHAGEAHDEHRHAGLARGFNLREVEVVLSAAIDPYFDGVAAFAVADGGFEVEEAFVSTRALPAGFVVKAGKFLSDVGYLNKQHPHAWSFTDRPLMSELLFGEHGLQETGVQVAWLPATPFYSRFGVEALQGDNASLAQQLVDGRRGPRLITAFAKVAPDLGYDHAVQAGVFGGRSSSYQALLEDPAGDVVLDGDARVWGADFVYKYDAGGADGKGSLVAQAEYARRTRNLPLSSETHGGYYAQAVYGFARRWNMGVRFDRVAGIADRTTAMVAWMPTEFSRLRLQVSRGDEAVDGVRDSFAEVFVQWQMSLGAHGAHAF